MYTTYKLVPVLRAGEILSLVYAKKRKLYTVNTKSNVISLEVVMQKMFKNPIYNMIYLEARIRCWCVSGADFELGQPKGNPVDAIDRACRQYHNCNSQWIYNIYRCL